MQNIQSRHIGLSFRKSSWKKGVYTHGTCLLKALGCEVCIVQPWKKREEHFQEKKM